MSRRLEINYQNKEALWQQCVQFHGHSCGGLTIGFQAAYLAAEKLELSHSTDEEIVCISENDACGVDAVQVLLGCSAGKGNLLFHLRGKQAFTIWNRTSGEGIRLMLKPMPEMPREKRQEYLMQADPAQLFAMMPPQIELPQSASIYESIPCQACGENAAEPFMRMQQGKAYCLDCYVQPKSLSRMEKK